MFGKVLSAALAVAAVKASADDPVLLWEVADPEIYDGGVRVTAEELGATAMQIKVSDGKNKDYLALWDGEKFDDGIWGLARETPSDPLQAGPSWARLSGEYGDYTGTAWSFTMELINNENGDWAVVASSAPVSYENLVTGKHISPDQLDLPGTTPWMPTFSTSAVPEPTGGAMLLVGAALLALRRRRRG